MLQINTRNEAKNRSGTKVKHKQQRPLLQRIALPHIGTSSFLQTTNLLFEFAGIFSLVLLLRAVNALYYYYKLALIAFESVRCAMKTKWDEMDFIWDTVQPDRCVRSKHTNTIVSTIWQDTRNRVGAHSLLSAEYSICRTNLIWSFLRSAPNSKFITMNIFL